MTTEEFNQKVEAAKLAKADAIVEAEQCAVLARMADDVALAKDLYMQDRLEATTDRLTTLDSLCERVTTEMPIFNSRTRENRKWRPSKVYNLGKHVELITGLCSGIQYSAAEHKVQMLAGTGISADLVDDVVNSMGSPAYYNKNYDIVMDEKPYNFDKLNRSLKLIANKLDLDADFSMFTEDTMKARFEAARVNADSAQATAQEELAKTELTMAAKGNQTINV